MAAGPTGPTRLAGLALTGPAEGAPGLVDGVAGPTAAPVLHPAKSGIAAAIAIAVGHRCRVMGVFPRYGLTSI